MKFLKAYNHLERYLERWTILDIGKFHFRIHYILSEDKTPFLHNHPFSYISIILSGGYTEIVEKRNKLVKVINNRFKIIIRSDKTFHRITSVRPKTRTLFLTFKKNKNWSLKKHEEIKIPESYWNAEDGLYQNKEFDYRLRKNGIWCVKNKDKTKARNEVKPSIHQFLDKNEWIKIKSKE